MHSASSEPEFPDRVPEKRKALPPDLPPVGPGAPDLPGTAPECPRRGGREKEPSEDGDGERPAGPGNTICELLRSESWL